MSVSVWEIRACGGDPDEICRAVAGGVALLRSEAVIPGLSADEQDCWREDVCDVVISEPASADDWTSTLVRVPLDHLSAGAPTEQVAAMLTGGLETAIADAVMAVPGVTQIRVTDRMVIGRP